MKRPTRVAICSVGATVGFAFLVIIVGVDPLTAPMVIFILSIGIYGRWLRDEAQIKFLMENFERNRLQFTHDSQARLQLTDPSFSNLPSSYPRLYKISL